MFRLREVSCIHDKHSEKDILTLSSCFTGTNGGTGADVRCMFHPTTKTEAAWQHLEKLLRKQIMVALTPQGYHDVEKFYPEDPECTCGGDIHHPDNRHDPNWHSGDCPLSQPA